MIFNHKPAATAAFAAFAILLAAASFCAGADARSEEDRRAFADGLFSREMYAMAATEYRHLLANFPNAKDVDALTFRFAESLRLSGDLNGAVREFGKVVSNKGSQYQQKAAFKRAAVYLDPKINTPDNAAFLFAELLKDGGLAPDIREMALYYNGEALLGCGDPTAARKSFEDQIRGFPKGGMAPFAKLSLGRIYAVSGDAEDLKRSEKILREVAAMPDAPARLAAEALFLIFRAKFSAEDFAAAAAAFSSLQEKYPEDERVAESRLLAAWAFLRAGLCDAAIAACSKAANDPALGAAAKAEYSYVMATAYFQLLRYKEAAERYRAVASDPAAGSFAAKSWYQLALCAFRDGDFDASLAALARVLSEPQLREDSLWLMAEAAAGKGDADIAVQNYRLLVSEYPSTKFGADPYYRLAHQLRLRESWLEASAYYLKLAELFPDSALAPKAVFASATSLSLAGQGARALRDWDEYLKRFPEDDGVPEALYQKALEEIRQDRKVDALATLDRFAARFAASTRFADAQFWRGQLLREKQSLADAEKAYRAALASNPTDEFARETKFALAQTLQLLERDDEAAAIFQELVSDPIRSKFTPHQFAWLSEHQYEKADYANASKTARALAAQTTDPAWAQTAHALNGRALLALKDEPAAKKSYEAAVALKIESRHLVESLLRLGDIEMRAHDPASAAQRYSRAARLASAPALADYRVFAYRGLGDAALAAGTPAGKEDAARYYSTIAALYKNDELIPPMMDKTISILEELDRHAEADETRRDLIKNYPRSPEAARRAAPPADAEAADKATEPRQ